MPLPAIIPAAVFLYGLFDLGVYATSGKDTIEHATGVDVVGGILEWIWPSAPTTAPVQETASGVTGISSTITIAMSVILLIVAAVLIKRRFD